MNSTTNKWVVFATPSSSYFAGLLVNESPCFELGQMLTQQHADGETEFIIHSAVQEQDIVLIGATGDPTNPSALNDLVYLGSWLAERAHRLKIVIPFLGDSTSERAGKKGEVPRLKSHIRMLETITDATSGTSFILMDLHAEATPGFFGRHTASHLYCEPIILSAIRECCGDDYVVAYADSGRKSWVLKYGEKLGVPVVGAYKQHTDGDGTEVTFINGSEMMKGKRVVLYDDMIRSGGSVINAAREFRNNGAASVVVVSTHGVLPNGSLEKMLASGFIEKVIVLDTCPMAYSLQTEFANDSRFEVISSAPLIASAILRPNDVLF